MTLLLIACSGAPSHDDPETTWSGVVSLDASTTVDVLTIEPGTTVQLGPQVTLTIEGELVARGTADEPIVFERLEADAAWGGLVFASTSSPATFEDLDAYAGGSILEYADVSGATRAITLDGASPYLHELDVHDNTLPNQTELVGGAGLLIQDGSTARVRDCRFVDNTAELFAFGGAVQVLDADPILQGNHFEGNQASYGGGLATDRMASPIVGNTFVGNDTASEGGGMSLISTVSAVLHNTVSENNATRDGGGIHVCVTCFPHAAPALLGNVVVDNTSESEHADESAGGVGAAYLRATTDNVLSGNTRDGEPSDFGWFHKLAAGYPEWVASPSLADNYWGTTDADAIEQAVFDGTDDEAFGEVGLDPVLDEAPTLDTPRVFITTRKLKLEEPGEEIPVFLTLYNPGPAATFTLELDHVVDGQDAALPDALDFPGAVDLGGGAWQIELPQDGVWFGELTTIAWDGSGGALDAAWTASLDGLVSEGRYVLGED